METFFVSTAVVFLGEIGDKTQLLALLLAAKFRKPAPIIAGILAATVLNHLFAAVLGVWVAAAMGASLLAWVVGVSFLGMAVWALIPDKLDADMASADSKMANSSGVFATTTVVFFLAEMGDKTQIATVALAARYQNLLVVVAGTTLGMMLADVPAVLFGQTLAKRVSMRVMRSVSALLFAVLGVLALFAAMRSF
jgi:Ca2+/H+ antiporter, TMEM165/GDT1 family